MGQLDGREGRHPRGTTDQQPLLPGQASRHGERVPVGDLDDPVGDVPVVGLGPEVLPYALDQVRAAGAAGVHRACGIGSDDLHVGPLSFGTALLEEPTDATDRAAGAHAGDVVGDPAVGLLPDLRAGLLVVCLLYTSPSPRDGLLSRMPSSA